MLRGFGLRLPLLVCGRWDAGVRDAVAGHSSLLQILDPLLTHAVLREQLAVLDKRVYDTARIDRVCRRLMTTPGVGAIVIRQIVARVQNERLEHQHVVERRPAAEPRRVSRRLQLLRPAFPG